MKLFVHARHPAAAGRAAAKSARQLVMPRKLARRHALAAKAGRNGTAWSGAQVVGNSLTNQCSDERQAILSLFPAGTSASRSAVDEKSTR
jgi:hypothetical protein